MISALLITTCRGTCYTLTDQYPPFFQYAFVFCEELFECLCLQEILLIIHISSTGNDHLGFVGRVI